MPRQQQQQQAGSDKSMDFLWILVMAMVAIFAIWYFGKQHISSGIFHVRFYEIYAIKYVYAALESVAQAIGLSLPQFNLDAWLVEIKQQMGNVVPFNELLNLSISVGNYLKYPLVLLILGGAAWLYLESPSHKYRHVYSTTTLKHSESTLWPQIIPVIDLNLVKAKLDDLPWAIALSPIRFCKKYDLLDVEERHGGYKATLRRGAAYRILSLQLGPKWSGIEALPMHHKALFAIFAARINNDKKTAEDLMDKISASAPAGSKPDFSGVDALLRKHSGSKDVGKCISLHGYVTTVLASMLVGARGVGVIASAEFIWLKPMDRRMWYMLNTVGRATAVPEISGAHAHWLAEKRLGLPLMVPMIDEAVKGLEVALTEVIYKPDEED